MINSRLQDSCAFDNGEYFFDDEFNIPFDANLRSGEEPLNISRSCRDLTQLSSELNKSAEKSSKQSYVEGSGGEYDNSAYIYANNSENHQHRLTIQSRGHPQFSSDTCLNMAGVSMHSNIQAPVGFEDEDYDDPDADVTDLDASIFDKRLLFSQMSNCSFLVENSEGDSQMVNSGVMGMSLNFRSKKMLTSSYTKDHYYMAYGGNDFMDMNRSSFYGDTNVSSWALKAVKKASKNATEEENEKLSKKPPMGPTMTSWGTKKNRGTTETTGMTTTDRGDAGGGGASGHHLLDVYSAQRGFDRNNPPPTQFIDKDFQQSLHIPFEAQKRLQSVVGGSGGGAPVRKVHSFSLRTKPIKYSSRAPVNSQQQRVGGGGVGHPSTNVSLPKSSKLEEQAFLSKTLPDLSFLGTFMNEKSHNLHSRKRAARKQQHHQTTANVIGSTTTTTTTGGGVGGDSVQSSYSSTTTTKDERGSGRRGSEPGDHSIISNLSMDISVHDVDQSQRTPRHLRIHEVSMKKSVSAHQLNQLNSTQQNQHNQPLKSCLIRRTSSGLGGEEVEEYDDSDSWSALYDRTKSMPSGINEDSTENYLIISYDDDAGNVLGVKKSVSFSDRNQLAALEDSYSINQSYRNDNDDDDSAIRDGTCSIPKSVGVYGHDLLVAEFPLQSNNQLMSGAVGASVGGPPGVKRDFNVRIQALVRDVVAAIEGMRRAYAQICERSEETSSPEPGGGGGGDTDTKPKFTPSGAHPFLLQSATEFFPVFYRLITDGLSSNTRQFTTKKPQSRLWTFIEESIRSGGSNRILVDALSETKSYTFLNTDQAKAKAFIFICLNYKALPTWWRHVSSSEPLLRRYYANDAFLRFCKSPQIEAIVEELDTSMELLLHIPFALPISRDIVNVTMTGGGVGGAVRPGYMSRSPSSQSNVRAASTNSPIRKVSTVPPQLASKFRLRTNASTAMSIATGGGSPNVPVTPYNTRSRPPRASLRVQRSHSARMASKISDVVPPPPPQIHTSVVVNERKSSALQNLPADCKIPLFNEPRSKASN